MKKLLNFLFSFPFMGFLLLIFAFSMAIATFVENSYGTEVAQALIYKSFWFSLILFLLAVNLLVNFIRYKMYLPNRIAVGLFHISFIIIVIGAGITRYISFEGMMHIREGQSSNYILSSDDYLTIKTGDQTIDVPVLFSEFTPNQVNEKLMVDGKQVHVKSVGFIKGAARSITANPSGTEMIDFVVSAGKGRENFTFSKGNKVDLGTLTVGYDVPNANFQFLNKGDSLFFVCDRSVELRSMTGGEAVKLAPNDTIAVQPMHLYAIDEYMLLVKQFIPKAIMTISKDTSGKAAENDVILEVSNGTDKQIVNVLGNHLVQGEPVTTKLGNSDFEFSYGSIPLYLPFSLQLTDFQMEKYPGSDSPASFASELVLRDSERNITRNVRVFMNNTLNYRGYKFFQSSYDQDEKGTILSVNADELGTTVTYIGYFLLGLGFVLALFSKNSHFHSLVVQLKKYSKATVSVILLFFLMNVGSFAATNSSLDSISRINQEVLNEFSRLWIQGSEGRIEPVSTLASEILRKVSRQSEFEGRSPEEVMLGMYLFPQYWRNVPLVKVSDDQLKQMLGVKESRVPLTAFFGDSGNYKLADQVKAAYSKAPAMRNMLEKEIINVDERVNICFMIINGDIFKLFPGKTKEVKWVAPGNTPAGVSENEALFVKGGFELLKEAVTGKSDISPEQIITSIAKYQNRYGSDYLPSDSRKNVEIFYDNFNPFKRVFPLYLLAGFVLLVVLFVNIFRQKALNSKVGFAFYVVIGIGFLIHTAGLILRWYISGHAPWSNGFESMVYVAWATMLAGLIFGRKYPFVIATGAIVSGIILFVAHLNWMNPEITNLVPVLNSYWLMIHVAIITASYGFIGLSAFIGLLVLILYSISTPANSSNVKKFILQLTAISEMSVTIGLYMLTIGTFIGGVWANESWGRYWGWDSKETWALITVVIYAFIAHMRMIPSLRGVYNYTVASVVGFSSVLMTYFGVNYYLSGMHSYGRGSIDSVHWSVFVMIAAIAGLLIVSNFKQKNINLEN